MRFQYAIFLGILLLLELTVGVLGFIFKDSIKAQATHGFQVFIKHYREDPDQQNLIDWIQEDWVSNFRRPDFRTWSRLTSGSPGRWFLQLQCCGIEGPKDWDRNNYFNCSSREVGSREACGVPFSCCKRKPNVSASDSEPIKPSRFLSPSDDLNLSFQEIIKNKQCGYDVRKPGYVSNFLWRPTGGRSDDSRAPRTVARLAAATVGPESASDFAFFSRTLFTYALIDGLRVLTVKKKKEKREAFQRLTKLRKFSLFFSSFFLVRV